MAPSTPIKEKEKTPPNKAKKSGLQRSPLSSRIRFGLTAKVTTLMLIVSLVPLIFFSAIALKKFNAHIQDETERLMATTTSDMTINVEEWIDKNVRVLKALAKMPDIISMNREKQEALLKAVAHEYPWMYLVFTLGIDGMNVARNDDKPLIDYSDREYYKEIIKGKEVAWQTLIGKTSLKPALVMAVPIKKDGSILGLVAMAATIEDLSRIVAAWKAGKTGFAFLIDEKGKVISHQIEDYVVKQTNLNDYPLIASHKKGQKNMINFNDNGIDRVGYAKDTQYGWTLAMQQDTAEMFKSLKETMYFSYILLGITAIIVCFVAWFFGRSIGAPIRNLTKVAERISIGDLGATIDIKSKDEIGGLAEAISRMQDSLRIAVERFRRR